MNLNIYQQQAVDHFTGPCVVLAGPGSGKTAVITERTIRLTEERHVDPGNILVVTFTRAAALEMKGRFLKKSRHPGKTRVSFGTFHGIFFSMLKNAFNLDASSIISDREASGYIGRFIDDLGVDVEDRAEGIRRIRGEISRLKGMERIPEDYVATSCDSEAFMRIFSMYNDALSRNRMVDFDDMMMKTFRLLNDRTDILDMWRTKYKFIMVDEFQDINEIQYKIVRCLASPLNNLFVVGDDDQAIYGFRGSDPALMIGFEKDYPDAEKVILKVNYRSKKKIVMAAGRLIAHNKVRASKEISAFREDGEEVETAEFGNGEEQYAFIADKIRVHHDSGLLFSQMAVIERTNELAGKVAQYLAERNIPVSYRGDKKTIYDHFAVQDIMAYIRVAHGDRRRENVIRAINRPNRYIPRDVFSTDPVVMSRVKRMVRHMSKTAKVLDGFLKSLEFVRRGTPASAIIYIRKAMHYDDFLREYAEKRHTDVGGFFKVLDDLTKDASGYTSFQEWFMHIEEAREEMRRENDLDENVIRDAVNITTMHGSKGLEYDVVFLPDSREGITPYHRSVVQKDIEEERRMYYVAMTRAAMKLYILWPAETNGLKATCSRFVKEILDF